jgi:hypothetical protein
MVARGRFKYRFKLSVSRLDFLFFQQNIPKMRLNHDFALAGAFNARAMLRVGFRFYFLISFIACPVV